MSGKTEQIFPAGNKIRYLIDENTLSCQLKTNIMYPIRFFSLECLGINQDQFINDLAPSFLLLAWDNYDVKRAQVVFLTQKFPESKNRLEKFIVAYYAEAENLESVFDLIGRLSNHERQEFERIKPRRKRSISKFILSFSSLNRNWGIERIPAEGFSQGDPENDIRTLRRVFKETSKIVTSHAELKKLLSGIATAVKEINPSATQLEITMHQVSIFADIMSEGDNSPEGIHQDGADYIVSALVIEREGIVGGESVIYGPDKQTEYLRIILQPGQGIFQADQNSTLWHYVTPIREDPDTPPLDGKRSILGFDINVLPGKPSQTWQTNNKKGLAKR